MTSLRAALRAHTPTPSRLGVLASGGGSNVQALIDHFADAAIVGHMVWVGSDRADAGALDRAAAAGIGTAVINAPQDGEALLAQLRLAGVELLVLAGYLKLVPEIVVQAYRGRLLNIHPALLPAFGGAGMYGHRLHAAVLAHGALITGATVHFVDEAFDRGPIVAQWPVPVLPGDSATMLAARVLRVEHQLLPLCVAAVASGAIVLGEDNRVHGHLDVVVPPTAPEWRFTMTSDAASGPLGLATDLVHLFPR